MIWLEFLTALDAIRTKARQDPGFQRPRSAIPADHAVVADLRALADEVATGKGVAVVTLELDSKGQPIIPDDMKALFATAPVDEEKPAQGQVGARVQRRNPPQTPTVNTATSKQPEATATVLPRETPHINRPPDLVEATESTVVS